MAEADRLAAALRYQQELDAAQRPATMNPNIAAQGAGSRNRIAAALASQAPSWPELASQAPSWYEQALPMEGRATFLPFQDTAGKRSWALPGIVAGAVNAFTAPGRALSGSDPNFDPQEEAANFALNVMGGGIGASRAAPAPAGSLGMNVWHGTPHRFPPTAKNPLGEFDPMKIGTGEGAQSYGVGAGYLAEAKSVGKTYSEQLATTNFKSLNPAEQKSILPQMEALYRESKRVGVDAAEMLLGKHIQQLKETIKYDPSKQNIEALNSLLKLKTNKEFAPELTKYLYKVDLPDEQIAKMLDWDKPINQQSPYVLNALEKAGINIESSALAGPMARGQENLLARHGIPGIRYLDQGSRTPGWSSLTLAQLDARVNLLRSDIASGGGNQSKMIGDLKSLEKERANYRAQTSNFVVFDPAHMNIIGRE